MTIVVDSQIPFFVETIHDGWPQVTVLPLRGEDITAAAVRDADVLVVRTRTRVDEALLRNSNVRMVCTATIGFDHIDTAYCESHPKPYAIISRKRSTNIIQRSGLTVKRSYSRRRSYSVAVLLLASSV